MRNCYSVFITSPHRSLLPRTARRPTLPGCRTAAERPASPCRWRPLPPTGRCLRGSPGRKRHWSWAGMPQHQAVWVQRWHRLTCAALPLRCHSLCFQLFRSVFSQILFITTQYRNKYYIYISHFMHAWFPDYSVHSPDDLGEGCRWRWFVLATNQTVFRHINAWIRYSTVCQMKYRNEIPGSFYRNEYPKSRVALMYWTVGHWYSVCWHVDQKTFYITFYCTYWITLLY